MALCCHSIDQHLTGRQRICVTDVQSSKVHKPPQDSENHAHPSAYSAADWNAVLFSDGLLQRLYTCYGLHDEAGCNIHCRNQFEKSDSEPHFEAHCKKMCVLSTLHGWRCQPSSYKIILWCHSCMQMGPPT